MRKSQQRSAGFSLARAYSPSRFSIFNSLPIYSMVLMLVPFLFLACGKRRPPQPPVERVPQRTEGLTGAQRGNQITLTWPAPFRNAPDSSVQSIRRVDIYRLAEEVTAPLPLTEEEFAARSTLIGSVDYDVIKLARPTLTYVDKLELAGEPTRLRYAVRYVNAAGQRASFSNFLLIEPAARIARSPSNVVATTNEKSIGIAWKAPSTNIDGTVPVNVLGYNVYRIARDATSSDAVVVNSSLIDETSFADKSFQFGEEYKYFVRAVSLGTGGQQVESLDSNIATIVPVDVYAPSSPTSITIAAAPGRLSLFYPANIETDVKGYDLFRSLDPDLPKDKWTKLNGELLTRTTFQDDKVETGKKYYYYLTAVDSVGNRSLPSDVVSETVP